jgi:hypothetical protein
MSQRGRNPLPLSQNLFPGSPTAGGRPVEYEDDPYDIFQYPHVEPIDLRSSGDEGEGSDLSHSPPRKKARATKKGGTAGVVLPDLLLGDFDNRGDAVHALNTYNTSLGKRCKQDSKNKNGKSFTSFCASRIDNKGHPVS